MADIGFDTLAEPPDFRKIAEAFVSSVDDPEDGMADAIEHLLVMAWNGRGEVDAKAVEDRLSTLTGWITSEPYRNHLRDAIATFDKPEPPIPPYWKT
jgi:hypothetical protein